MLARYRNISDANLTFMASSNLHAVLGSVLDDHYALLLLAGTLKDEVVSSGLVHADHFLRVPAAAAGHLNIPGKLCLANLAFKLGEVIVLSASDHFLFNLDADPLGEALEVN